jgi:hypothetical protein
MKNKSVGILTKPKFPEAMSTLQDVVVGSGLEASMWFWTRRRPFFSVNKGPIRKCRWHAKRCTSGVGRRRDHAQCRATCRGTWHSHPRGQHGWIGVFDEVRLESLYPSLERVFANDFVLDERLMLRTHIHRPGETVAQGVVLNDVVSTKARSPA